MKIITNKEPIMALLAGTVLIIGISTTTIYFTGHGGPSAAYAAAETFTDVQKIPVDRTEFFRCAADGAGEFVHITGQLNVISKFIEDNAGGSHALVHFNYQGVSGTGLTTGDQYRVISNNAQQNNIKVVDEITQVETFRLVSQGGETNLLFQVTAHITFNADGTVTVQVINTNIECK
jgi:hypothetical protein